MASSGLQSSNKCHKGRKEKKFAKSAISGITDGVQWSLKTEKNNRSLKGTGIALGWNEIYID